MLKPGNYEVLVFRDRGGKCPYTEWLDLLGWKTRQRILNRVGRIKHGQFGDFKALGGEVYEIRLFFGPGYRVYFGVRKGSIVLILAGGDKSTQQRDITRAKGFWKMYLEDNS